MSLSSFCPAAMLLMITIVAPAPSKALSAAPSFISSVQPSTGVLIAMSPLSQLSHLTRPRALLAEAALVSAALVALFSQSTQNKALHWGVLWDQPNSPELPASLNLLQLSEEEGEYGTYEETRELLSQVEDEMRRIRDIIWDESERWQENAQRIHAREDELAVAQEFDVLLESELLLRRQMLEEEMFRHQYNKRLFLDEQVAQLQRLIVLKEGLSTRLKRFDDMRQREQLENLYAQPHSPP